MLIAVGCGQSHTMGDSDAEVAVEDGGFDGGSDAGFDAGPLDGTWETCCVGGVIDSCFCEAGWSCNYGWFTHCGGATCAFSEDECPDAGTPDAGAPDAGGEWAPCCVDGIIDSCFCAAGDACEASDYIDCGDGTCGPSMEACGDVDAGTPDAGADGFWEPCCVGGVIDSCFCPGGAICNYGWFTDCGDGLCADGGSMCPAPPPAP